VAKAAKRAPKKAKGKASGKLVSKSKSAKPAVKKGGTSKKGAKKGAKKSKAIKKKPVVKVVKLDRKKSSKAAPPKIAKEIAAVVAKASKPVKSSAAAKAVLSPTKTVIPPATSKSALNGKMTKFGKSAKIGKSHRAASRLIPFTPPLINESRTAAPVPTNSKPRKNQAGFLTRELEHFRELLLAKRGEIVGDMSAMEREALRTSGGSNLSTLPIHMADMGTDNYEQEFTLSLVETERKLLREINNALAKIQNGAFGICEGTGKPIGKARLEVQPWARYSIEHAKQMERTGKGYQI